MANGAWSFFKLWWNPFCRPNSKYSFWTQLLLYFLLQHKGQSKSAPGTSFVKDSIKTRQCEVYFDIEFYDYSKRGHFWQDVLYYYPDLIDFQYAPLTYSLCWHPTFPDHISGYIPYARHYNPRFVYFLRPKAFWRSFFFVNFWLNYIPYLKSSQLWLRPF